MNSNCLSKSLTHKYFRKIEGFGSFIDLTINNSEFPVCYSDEEERDKQSKELDDIISIQEQETHEHSCQIMLLE